MIAAASLFHDYISPSSGLPGLLLLSHWSSLIVKMVFQRSWHRRTPNIKRKHRFTTTALKNAAAHGQSLVRAHICTVVVQIKVLLSY